MNSFKGFSWKRVARAYFGRIKTLNPSRWKNGLKSRERGFSARKKRNETKRRERRRENEKKREGFFWLSGGLGFRRGETDAKGEETLQKKKWGLRLEEEKKFRLLTPSQLIWWSFLVLTFPGFCPRDDDDSSSYGFGLDFSQESWIRLFSSLVFMMGIFPRTTSKLAGGGANGLFFLNRHDFPLRLIHWRTRLVCFWTLCWQGIHIYFSWLAFLE